MKYIAAIHKEGTSDFGVSFPDFPGCVTAGSNLQEAMTMAQEALAGHIALMVDTGQAVPAPSAADAVMQDSDFQDAVLAVVDVSVPSRTIRVNITVEESDLAQIDAAAVAHGLSRSKFLVDSALERV